MTHPSDWLMPNGRVQPIPGDDDRQDPPTRASLPTDTPIAESLRVVHVLPFCRCPDPHSTIGATGPVVCRNCGRRIGGDR